MYFYVPQMDLKMKYLLICTMLVGGCLTLNAQIRTKYFLNKREIAPQSVFFLNQEDIDSVTTCVQVVTIVTLFSHNPEKVLSYYEVLERYRIAESGRTLPVNLEFAADITDPVKLVFSIDMISEVAVRLFSPSQFKSIWIYKTYQRLDRTSKKGKILSEIRRKFNVLN
jgi:hypothetical protein